MTANISHVHIYNEAQTPEQIASHTESIRRLVSPYACSTVAGDVPITSSDTGFFCIVEKGAHLSFNGFLRQQLREQAFVRRILHPFSAPNQGAI